VSAEAVVTRKPLEPKGETGRRTTNLLIKIFAWIAALIGIAIMAFIIYYVFRQGAASMFRWGFFTELPPSPGEGTGGLENAIVGTLLLVSLAALVGIPLGFLGGVYLAEFGRTSPVATTIRTVANMMVGLPSIIVGVFAYTALVVTTGHYSVWAGAFALAIIMIPVMARTSEDIMNLVPNEMRESGLALGAARYKVTLGVVVKAARNGLVTAGLLAVVRVSGETAPLLFTVMNSQFMVDLKNLSQPTANLTVTIFQFSQSPYKNWQDLAWGGALLIIIFVLGMNILTRLLFSRKKDW
jgi:phosphate transport system permease protein